MKKSSFISVALALVMALVAGLLWYRETRPVPPAEEGPTHSSSEAGRNRPDSTSKEARGTKTRTSTESGATGPGKAVERGATLPAPLAPPAGVRPAGMPLPVPEMPGISSGEAQTLAGRPGPASRERSAAQMEAVRGALHDFRSALGENPVGTNAEIVKALQGDNRKGAHLGPGPGLPLNSAGELVDPWGTPYFFHQLSRDDMEIRSAGPDRRMWTDDDQVTK